jgi:hypothetical protein
LKILAVVDFNTDTIRFRTGLHETIIDIEIDHGPCVESYSMSVDRSEVMIMRKIMDGSIILGVQDETGD